MTTFDRHTICIISSNQPHNQYAGGSGGVEDSEQYWCRLLALELAEELEKTGHTIYLAPEFDSGDDYADNVAWVNKSPQCESDLEISLHTNATGQSGTKATGVGCYHHPSSSKGEDFARSAMPFLEPASAAGKAYVGTLTVAELANTKPPAVLFENEYHDWEGSVSEGGSKWIRDAGNRTGLVAAYRAWISDLWGSQESAGSEPEVPEDIDIKVASYNAQAKQWGGGSYSADVDFMLEDVGASVYFTQETDEAFRDTFRDRTDFKVWANGMTALFWDGSKYSYGDDIEMDFDTAYHALIGKVLVRDGIQVAAASIHVKPNDAYPSDWSDEEKREAKLADIQRALDVLDCYDVVMVGGDWNTSHHKDVLEVNGYTLATPWEPTTDDGKYLDAIWTKGIQDRSGGSIIPTSASDHHALVANLTLLCG